MTAPIPNHIAAEIIPDNTRAKIRNIEPRSFTPNSASASPANIKAIKTNWKRNPNKDINPKTISNGGLRGNWTTKRLIDPIMLKIAKTVPNFIGVLKFRQLIVIKLRNSI